MKMEYRKLSELTPEEKREIAEYSESHTRLVTSKYHNVSLHTVRACRDAQEPEPKGRRINPAIALMGIVDGFNWSEL